jgi:hypothetical protein
MVKRGILWGPITYVTWAHKPEHIEKTATAMKESLEVVKKSMECGDIDSFLEGDRSVTIFKKSVSAGSKK